MTAISIDFWLAVWLIALAALLAGIDIAFNAEDLRPVYRILLFLGSAAIFFLPCITVFTTFVG